MLNNTQRKQAINNRQSFKGVNSQGYFVDNEYIIKSYDTIIYSDSKGLDYNYYSQTTRKLQNVIRDSINLWENKTVVFQW